MCNSNKGAVSVISTDYFQLWILHILLEKNMLEFLELKTFKPRKTIISSTFIS